jgi:hypothetical protein
MSGKTHATSGARCPTSRIDSMTALPLASSLQHQGMARRMPN